MNEHQPPHHTPEAAPPPEAAEHSRPLHGWHPSMGTDRFLSTWDAPPRDGPAVFIADLATHDLLGAMRGRWLDPSEPPEDLREQIAEVVGADGLDTGRWGVLDQLEAGAEMVPEQLSVAALAHWFRTHQRRGDGSVEQAGGRRPVRVLRGLDGRYSLGNGAES